MWYRKNIWTVQNQGPGITPWRTVIYIHTTSCGLHICFQTTRPLWMQFCYWLRHQRPTGEIFYVKQNGQTKHILHLKTCSSNLHAIHRSGYQLHFSIGDCARIVRVIIVDVHSLCHRLNSQRYRGSMNTVGLGLFHVLLAGSKFDFSKKELQRTKRKMTGCGVTWYIQEDRLDAEGRLHSLHSCPIWGLCLCSCGNAWRSRFMQSLSSTSKYFYHL